MEEENDDEGKESMSITMKLDAHAVRALIKDDEKVEMELQQAVINEIIKGLYPKSIPENVREMIDKTFAEKRTEIVTAMQSDVGFRAHVDNAMSAMVQSIRASTNSYTVQRTLSDEVKRMISNHIAHLVEQEVEKHKDALNVTVEAMVKRLEERIEAGIEQRLEQMDRSYHDIAHRKVMERFNAFAKEQQA